MSASENSYRGWGTILLQIGIGAAIFLVGFTSDTGPFRYGRGAEMLFGSLLLLVGLGRLLVNLVGLLRRKPIAGAGILLGLAVLSGVVVAAYERAKAADIQRRELGRPARLASVRLGMSEESVVSTMGRPDVRLAVTDPPSDRQRFFDVGCPVGLAEVLPNATSLLEWADGTGQVDLRVWLDAERSVGWVCKTPRQ